VEPPGTGDSSRRTGPYAHDVPSLDSSLLFNYLNGNKLGLTLDIGCATGQELLFKLLENADVFLYGGPASDVDRLGLGYEQLRAVNPSLIATYVTPFGLTGPYRNYKSNEVITAQLAGLAFDTPGGVSDPDKPPIKPGGRHGLMVAGLSGAMATLHALFARDVDGNGREADVSELEPIASFQFLNIIRHAFSGEVAQRGAMQAGALYETQDGTASINPMQDHMWRAMVHVMGDPSWAADPEFATRAGRTANRDAMSRNINEWTRTLPKEEVYQKLQEVRVPAFPTNSIPDVLASSHMQAREFFEEIPLPSGELALATGPRYKFSDGVPGITRPAPRLGEHTMQILTDKTSLNSEDLVTLFELGII